jgi:hypothetical protein
MATKLKKEQITILSEILEVEESVLLILSGKGMIDYPAARAAIIKKEYGEMLRGGMQNKNIVATLMSKYKLSKSSVEKAIYKKK